MLFNSFTFLVFLVIVVCLYFALPYKLRNAMLLAASYVFYMAWNPKLIVLIVFSTFVNYAASLKIYNSKSGKKTFLILSLIVNFGLLFVFKYMDFAAESFVRFIALFGLRYPEAHFDIILPMGISFYTFQASAYTIDVYREKIKPERNFFTFALFISFFPQLVAGPIERSQNLLPQFYEKHDFNFSRAADGIKIMLIGFFKKIVVADRIAVAVNTVYNSPSDYGGLCLFAATFLFAFQIYCDFSGYSDIAQGAAKILGFSLMDNFKKPYLSLSIREFWKRWHISLSTWFMDYVYIPLGGNRKGVARKRGNLFLTFLISGLWHGANWTFVVWGAIHGIYMVIGDILRPMFGKVKGKKSAVIKILSVFITFTLTDFAWIFFRANTISEGIYIAKTMFSDVRFWFGRQYFYEALTSMGVGLFEVALIAVSLFVLVVAEILSRKESVFGFFEETNVFYQMVFYVIIFSLILTAGVYYDSGAFIYFQF
ncbi:MAG: MBOAT family O-acyltransferase [Lachnospiraceae bacterium]|nr:MBOAT family O-acyltransferase [Lachnospiraceae bacterium]